MNNVIKIYNGNLITPFRIIRGGTIVLIDGVIKEVSESNLDIPDATEIDARGNYVSPGFIDIHVHGGGGFDFMDGTEEAFLAIAQLHAKHGTTSMMPTTLTSEKEDLFKSRPPINWLMQTIGKGHNFLECIWKALISQ